MNNILLLWHCKKFVYVAVGRYLWDQSELENSHLKFLRGNYVLHMLYVVNLALNDVGHVCKHVLFLKVALIQKGLMRFSFLQTDEPKYFPELEFDFFHSKWLKSCQIRNWSCSNAFFEHSEQLHVFIWHDLSHLEWKKNQNSSSGK